MAPRRKGKDGLTLQEGLFVEHYLACNCNGREAARRAGYKGNDNVLGVQAHDLLSRPKVHEALTEKRKAIEMSALEVTQRHSEIARASFDDFLDEAETPELDRARARGKLHLLKKFTVTTRTIPNGRNPPIVERRVTYELHDAQAAQVTLMKYHGLLAESQAIRDLAKNEDELVALAMKEIERVTGKPVPRAAEKPDAN